MKLQFPWTTCGRVAEAFGGPHGISEVERPPEHLRSLGLLFKMNTVYTCPGCKQETVMWDSRAGSFWCSNPQCPVRFTRSSDPNVFPQTSVPKVLAATMVVTDEAQR
jgi:ribosomal protein L37AE/L43A